MVSNPNPPGSMPYFIKKIGTGRRMFGDLTREEAAAALRKILAGEATPAQAGGFLVTLRVKGETPEELAGFVAAIREGAAPVPPVTRQSFLDVGNPYDGKTDPVHLSIAAACLVAAAGGAVAFHGARRVSPKYGVGIGEVMGELGVRTDLPPEAATAMLNEAGVAYVDQAQYAPSLAGLLPLRRELGLRTGLSAAEKLANPLKARVQIVGAHHGSYLAPLAEALRLTGGRPGVVVQGAEGSVDIAPGHSARVVRVHEGDLAEELVDPSVFGVTEKVLPPATDPAAHAAAISKMLEDPGAPGAQTAAFNAGLWLAWSGAAAGPAAGIARARALLEQGAGAKALAALRNLSGVRAYSVRTPGSRSGSRRSNIRTTLPS